MKIIWSSTHIQTMILKNNGNFYILIILYILSLSRQKATTRTWLMSMHGHARTGMQGHASCKHTWACTHRHPGMHIQACTSRHAHPGMHIQAWSSTYGHAGHIHGTCEWCMNDIFQESSKTIEKHNIKPCDHPYQMQSFSSLNQHHCCKRISFILFSY